MDFKLRIIKKKKFFPYLNMSIDESLFLNNDDKTIILRFFGWDRPSISIGIFQKIEELNIDFINEKNIPIVRRPTGGKGVYHNDELTYSIIIPSTHSIYNLNVINSYKIISNIFINSLKELGISAELTKKSGKTNGFCFSTQNYYEVSIDGKKIIGSAQRRKKDGILQQGSVPFTIDYEIINNIFKLSDNSGFISLKEVKKDLEIEELEDILIKNFIEYFDTYFEIKDLSEEELIKANNLLNNKYSLDSWNLYGIYWYIKKLFILWKENVIF